ncbi:MULTISPECIES: hypothetical protein [Lactobacillus]|uniref:hypothetical protein n=1 Tax=Lactobacillus TaxID=1578 RepID=UPI001580C9ED|nr:hypothetical protein [Lactobacillus melliventris]NUE97587.1 hypothetical protein [Lactobacillus melliventris]
MSRKKIELTEKVAKLTDKYLETTDTEFNDLINKALKLYLLDHLSSSQIKDALKKTDNFNSAYAGKWFQESIEDLNKY